MYNKCEFNLVTMPVKGSCKTLTKLQKRYKLFSLAGECIRRHYLVDILRNWKTHPHASHSLLLWSS